MSENELSVARHDLTLANRVLDHQGVLDAFGHVSARHPSDPDLYLISSGKSPGSVEDQDILTLTLDGDFTAPTKARRYGEIAIHGEIYRARPDIKAICHMHTPAIVGFAISGVPVVPVFHLGATAGTEIPFWDSRDEFGDTDLRVSSREQGASLARALGKNWSVILRRHGAVVCGRTTDEMVFRSVNLQHNCELQYRAHVLGHVSPLSPVEAEQACAFNTQPHPVARAWNYWRGLLEKDTGFV